jgi:hypothetical protein
MKNPLNKMEILLMWLRKEFPEHRWQRRTCVDKIYLLKKTKYTQPHPKYDYWEFFKVAEDLGTNVLCFYHGPKPDNLINLVDPSCLEVLKKYTKKQLRSIDKWYGTYG